MTLLISGARRTWSRRDSSFSPYPTTRSGHIQPGRRDGDEVNPLSKDGPVCSMRERHGRERRLERIAAAPSFSPGPTRFYGVSAPNSRHRLRSTLRGVWPAQHQHEEHHQRGPRSGRVVARQSEDHHRGPRSGRVVARQSSSGSLTSEAAGCSWHQWAIHRCQSCSTDLAARCALAL